MALPIQLPHLGPRTRKIVKYVGYVVLAIVTFIFAFQLTFPFQRVKAKVEEILSEKYDVTIGDIDRGWMPGRIYFKAVTLRTRPTKPSDVATTFYMEQLEVDVGLLAFLRGKVSVDIDAKIGAGHITGNIGLSKDETHIDLTGSDLPSANLPMREALGLPMTGKIRFAFDLDLPNETSKAGRVAPNWPKAEGSVELACPSGCTIGDGKTKLKPTLKNQRNQAFAEGGIDFGKVNIDTLLAKVEIKNGKLEVTKFETKSDDGELHVDFLMTLDKDFQASMVTGCLRFTGSAALLKREPKTHAALSTTGAPLGPDNLFHIKLDGQLREMRRLGQVCGQSTNTNMDNPGGGGAPSRPNLTVTPDTPSKPPVFTPPPPPPAVPPPSPPPPGVPPPGAPGPGGSAMGSGEAPPPAAPPGAPPPPGAAPVPVPEGSGTAGAGGVGVTPR